MAQRSLPSVVVLGGTNMDLGTLTPRFAESGETVAGTPFLAYPGGKGGNQAGVTAFDKLQQKGLARFFGFTGFGSTSAAAYII